MIDPVCVDPTIADGGVVAVANGMADTSADTARELYVAILNSSTSTEVEKRCAAVGIGALLPDTEEPADGLPAVLAGIQKGWNEFFDAVVDPFWAVFVPFLIVLGILLLLSRLLARFTVGPNTAGARDRSRWTRSTSFLVHWMFGVGSLVLTALLLTVGMALVAQEAPPTEITTLLGVYSIVVGLLGIGFVVATAFGTAPNHLGWPFWVLYLLVTLGCGVWWIFGRNAGNDIGYALAGLAVLIAALGLWTVARGNGLQIGMLIEGRKADGAADASVAQRVQAQLYAMTISQPGQAGIMIPRDTDASIPDGALDLVPEGTAAKAVKAIAGALWPTSSWRATVDAVGNGKVHVTVFRNGRYVDAATIRRSDFVPASSAATISAVGVVSPNPADEAEDALSSDVWVGVSAFILVTLARRYAYLDAGIYQVRDWRSIAAHAAAADGALSERETARLLLAAVSFDGKNVAAELARINQGNGKKAGGDDQIIKQLNLMKYRLAEAKLLDGPMGLRLGFNLAVAQANLALLGNPTATTLVPGADVKKVETAWAEAAAEIETVLAALFGKSGKFFNRFGLMPPTAPADLEGFYNTLRGSALAVGYLIAGSKVSVAPNTPAWLGPDGLKNLRRLADMAPKDFERAFSKLETTTLARYERVCVYAYQGDYGKVGMQVPAIAGSETIRNWAREDPSLDGWWEGYKDDDQAYRVLLEDPTPGIVNVGPFAAYQDQLAVRGMATAEQLCRRAPRLAAELGLGDMVGEQWRRIAGLQVSLAGTSLDPQSDAILLSRLLALGIDSETRLVAEIRKTCATSPDEGASLVDRLKPRRTGYAWSPPTAESFRLWARGRP